MTLVAKAELAQSYKDQEITLVVAIFSPIYLLGPALSIFYGERASLSLQGVY